MKKNYLILLLLLATLIFSCKSDDEENQTISDKYFVKFKVNDIQKNDYYNPKIDDFEESSIFEEYPSGSYTFQLLDIISVQFKKEGFKAQYYSSSSFDVSANTPMRLRWFKYVDPATGIKFESTSNISGSNMTFNIIEVKNGEVRGTFSGKFNTSTNGNSTGNLKTFNITNGEFYVPIKP